MRFTHFERQNKITKCPQSLDPIGALFRMRKARALQGILKNREALGHKAHDLLKILQSEITHQLSSPCFQNHQTAPPGDFTVEWDAPNSHDIVLRKKCDTGEEVVVSALTGPAEFKESTYPRSVGMKVCIKKPGLSSILQFGCDVLNTSHDGPEYFICSAEYLKSKSSRGPRYYTAPLFRDLDPRLQDAFKDYLETKGIGESLINFLLVHMHKKQEQQYINWLQKVKGTVSRGD